MVVETGRETAKPGKTDEASVVLKHKNGWELHLSRDTPVIWLSNLLKQLT
jgi:hypothetical protein